MKTDASRFIAFAALLWGALIAAAKLTGVYLGVLGQVDAAAAFHRASIGLLVSGALFAFGTVVMGLCLRLGRRLHLRTGVGAGRVVRPARLMPTSGAEEIRFRNVRVVHVEPFNQATVTWDELPGRLLEFPAHQTADELPVTVSEGR